MLDSERCHLDTYAPVTSLVNTRSNIQYVTIAYVTLTIVSEDSANPSLFQQWASDVNEFWLTSLAQMFQYGSALNLR